MTIIPDRGYTSKVGCVSNQMKWDLSSAGRASALQAEGHRFEPYRSHPFQNLQYGEIAQLARAHGSYPWCRGFESPSRYLTGKPVINKYGILAQLGEHLPYKQRVIGSSPIGSICRSGGTGRRPGLKIPWVVIPVPVRFRSAAVVEEKRNVEDTAFLFLKLQEIAFLQIKNTLPKA